MTATSPFHFLIKLPSQKQTNNSFSHISDGERMIYKNLPDCVSFNHLCKQIWRLIRATLISRNYASASWMPLPWLQDSTAIMEATFIKSKLERSLSVLSLPLTEEWPQLNSLWWHWQLINSGTLPFQSYLLITAQNFFHVTAPWKVCAWPASAGGQLPAIPPTSDALVAGALFASSWVLPVSKVESSKSTACNCWLRSFSEGEGNHLQFPCLAGQIACIFPCH